MSTYPKKIRIVEVGPRDGLQNEKKILPTQVKIDFIDMLADVGLQNIEAGAFVSPKWVPQMADSDAVLKGIRKKEGVSYPVLVPNEKGMEAAIAAGADEIAVFAAASEAFSQKNINCTVAESLARFDPVIKMARERRIKVRGYVSCVLGCPYQGAVDPASVASVAQKLFDMGCYEISLGDTIGIGTPQTTRIMLQAVKKNVPVSALAVHFHDTYGRALENIKVALEEGISVIDSAAAGLGGCPYAQGATGNVATEKVLQLMADLGIETGIDAAKVRAAAVFIRNAVEKPD